MTDYISRADVKKVLREDWVKKAKMPMEADLFLAFAMGDIDNLPSVSANSDDLIIKNGKGIQDGLYNIKDGEIFKYKAKGGTVRVYKLVECVSAERVGEWQRKLVHYTDGSHGYRLKCSVCEEEWLSETNYCPNCGARMENKK